jgi:YD repeat-containing protein
MWNTRNQLVSTPSGSTISYDALGRMVARTTNGSAETYLYDGLNALAANGNLMLRGGGLDELEAEVSSSGVLSYLTDALGSPSMLTNSAQAATSLYSYGGYGATAGTAPGGPASKAPGPDTQPTHPNIAGPLTQWRHHGR